MNDENKFGIQNLVTSVAIIMMSGLLLYGYFFGQSLALYLLIVFFVGILILTNPKVGLSLIFVCTMWFERYFTLEPLRIGDQLYKAYPIDFIIGFILLSFILLWLKGKKIDFKLYKFDWLILIFIGLVSLNFVYSLFTSNDPALAFGTYKNYALYGIVYFFCILLLQTKQDWKNFMLWLSVGGLGLFFFLAFGVISGSGLWSEYTPLSTMGSRLIAGSHVFFLVIFSFWALANYLWPDNLKIDKILFKKILFWVLLICAFGIIVSLVRHLWLALVIIITLWFIYLKKEQSRELLQIFKKTVVTLFFVFIIGFWLSSLFSLDLFNTQKITSILSQRVDVSSVISLEDSSFRWRLSTWLEGSRVWLRQPILGTGLGYVISGYVDVYFFEIAMRELHNNYLGLLFQLGIAIFAFVTYWFIYMIRKIHKSVSIIFNNPDPEIKRLFFTWSNIFILFVVIFAGSVYWDINYFIIWWWLALAGLRFVLDESKEI